MRFGMPRFYNSCPHHRINRLKQWRGLATRYEKRAFNYRAMVVLASTIIWLDS
jgi:transposase